MSLFGNIQWTRTLFLKTNSQITTTRAQKKVCVSEKQMIKTGSLKIDAMHISWTTLMVRRTAQYATNISFSVDYWWLLNRAGCGIWTFCTVFGCCFVAFMCMCMCALQRQRNCKQIAQKIIYKRIFFVVRFIFDNPINTHKIERRSNFFTHWILIVCLFAYILLCIKHQCFLEPLTPLYERERLSLLQSFVFFNSNSKKFSAFVISLTVDYWLR